MDVRVRFAPSPTGHLHIGSARTVLFNWLFAKHHHGTFLVRIEDTDLVRSTQEYTQSVLESLAWLSMTSDEPPVVQSHSLARYQAAIAQLLDAGHAYRCYCTPEELEQRLIATPYGTRYDRHCRTVTPTPDKAHVIRFKVPDGVRDITFHDEILGDITVPAEQIDDFVLMRSDGMPMYNFAVVVDDIFTRITHVIRGQEHIANTPKQMLLYHALKQPVPRFGHLPVILNKEGGKLSKRDGAVSIIDYRAQGFLASALMNFLARLGWAHGNQEIFTVDELIKHFDFAHVGKSNAVFDLEKLLWVNGEHIKRATPAQLCDLITRDIDPQFVQACAYPQSIVCAALALYQSRAQTLVALRDAVCALLKRPEAAADAVAAVITPVKTVLIALLSDFSAMEEWTAPALELVIKQRLAQAGVGIAPVAHAVRAALTGQTAGAGVYQMLAVVGKQESMRRIEAVCGLTQ